MARTLTCLVTIGNKKFKFGDFEIINDNTKLYSSCKITLPTKGVVKGNNDVIELSKIFKVGDKVKVMLGYDGNNKTEFVGYLTRIHTKVPVVLECEDKMYLYKKIPAPNMAFTGDLKTLIKKLGEEVKFSDDFPSVSLVNFIIKNITVAEALQKIKETYKLAVYFNSDALYCGLAYLDSTRTNNIHKFDFQTIVSNNLEYRTKEQVKLKAKATSILRNNTKISVEVGDKEGEQRSLFFRNVTNKSALKKIAEEELRRLKYDGYSGSFTAFGIPSVQHSETVHLVDKRFDREGKYVIKKVIKTYNMSGFRQKIDIGFKV